MAHAMAKCSDCFSLIVEGAYVVKNGYVSVGLNIGGGDYIDIMFCLDCGHMVGEWPVDMIIR